MNVAAIAIITCLWAQAPGEGEQFEPHLRRSPKAPAVEFDDAPAETEAAPEAVPAQHRAHERAAEPSQETAQDLPHGQHHQPAADADEKLSTVDHQGKQKLRPPELLAEALETLRGGALVGSPLSLQQALAGTVDRPQQLKIAQAYWRLCLAQADYNWLRNGRDLLGEYTQSHTNHPALLSARASARADMRDAQLAVSQAQEELGDLLPRRGDLGPVLASDRPHVGDYNTHYDAIFGARLPPPRIRLVHRTLPVRRKAIDAHGEAIVAAIDALESTGEEFKQHGQGLTTLLSALDQLKRERQAFLADVRAYNQEIAEYAFAVAPAGTNGAVLVSMLIKTAPPPRNRSGQKAPPPSDRVNFTQADADESAPIERTANYQNAPADDAGVYEGLLQIDAPQRVQRLANLLHWDRNLPADSGEGSTLADCLRGVGPRQRMNVIGAYWHAREEAARYQAMADQVEQLGALPALAIDLRHHPALAVRLQAARRAARAGLLDAHARLLAAEFELTQAAGRRLDEPWLLPSTPPQSGRYIVDNGRRDASPARRWGEKVRLHHEKLEERADGVIQSDIERAKLIKEARGGEATQPAGGAAAVDTPMPLDVVLESVARQNHETMRFLHDLTEYNMAIARFALATWAESISSDELVKKLVVARTTRRDI
jgi:hypothetical protein